MNKTALVINKEELLKLPNRFLDGKVIEFTDPRSIFNADFSLLPRDTCETDESVVQILPYITLIDIKTREVFTYRRGSSGGENRLRGQASLGLGGHVEEYPIPSFNIVESLKYVSGALAMNIIRELNEEVGLEITYGLLDEIQQTLLCGDFNMFYSEQDQVAKHHLCLYVPLWINKGDLNKKEDCIADPSWKTFDEIMAEDYFDLEGWSKICLGYLKEALL